MYNTSKTYWFIVFRYIQVVPLACLTFREPLLTLQCIGVCVMQLILFSQVSTNKQTIFFGVVVYFDLTFSPVLIKNSYIYIQTSWPYIYIYMYTHHIAGNFRGRKLSRITLFCGYPRIFSSQNLGVWHPLTRPAICKTFSMKIVFFTNSQKFFSLESFPLYGTLFCFSMFVLGL